MGRGWGGDLILLKKLIGYVEKYGDMRGERELSVRDMESLFLVCVRKWCVCF